MNKTLSRALVVAGMAITTQAAASVVFYENENFGGRSFSAQKQVVNFERTGFNDRSSSVVVLDERWEVCEHAQFGGKCVVLRPGRYASLGAMGLNDRVSSVRIVSKHTRVDDQRYAPQPVPVYDNRRRNNERLYQANVTSSRAVGGTPQQRCWMEREQVAQQPQGANVPGAVIGAILGGVLGHQVGSGHGNTAATVIGAGAGGYFGSTVGRDKNGQPVYADVQRCATDTSQSRPDYWDVTYDFKGQQHRMQMAGPPGNTVTVNGKGEPRA
ncbi:beta/gamma crystallin-related protein [Usitatibacter palustris]|nr:beta/gamma crystallin-related protein [Usitatibacter palustris]